LKQGLSSSWQHYLQLQQAPSDQAVDLDEQLAVLWQQLSPAVQADWAQWQTRLLRWAKSFVFAPGLRVHWVGRKGAVGARERIRQAAFDAWSKALEALSQRPPAITEPTAKIIWPGLRSMVVKLSQAAASEQLGVLARRGAQSVRCIAVIERTADVKSFVLASEPPSPWFYKPGQHISLRVQIDGEAHQRSYTVSSAPTSPYALEITVRRQQGGRVSSWLHEHCVSGTQLLIRGPQGGFSGLDWELEPLLMLSAGVGITPFLSMLRYYDQSYIPYNVVLFEQLRTKLDPIAANELDAIRERAQGRLDIVRWFSRDELNPRRLEDITHLDAICEDWRGRRVMLCGPKAWMDRLIDLLKREGLPDASIAWEQFGAQPMEVPGERTAEPATAKPLQDRRVRLGAADSEQSSAARVRVHQSGAAAPTDIVASRGDFLLDVLEDASVPMRSNCRSGQCGTCKVKLISGQIQMLSSAGLSMLEREAGWILSCSCRLEVGELEVKLPSLDPEQIR
jgi:ferredoxin-NADP reductase/ferredoxin